MYNDYPRNYFTYFSLPSHGTKWVRVSRDQPVSGRSISTVSSTHARQLLQNINKVLEFLVENVIYFILFTLKSIENN
jgi:hypothetical protein